MSTSVTDALRNGNFDWTVMLRDIWKDSPTDVPAIHEAVRKDFVSALDALAKSRVQSSPAGWVLVGQGGTGKTHLLGHFRVECTKRKGCFILVDLTDVHDFWDTVLLGYFTSLQEAIAPGKTQFEQLIEGFLGNIRFKEPIQSVLNRLKTLPADRFRAAVDVILQAFHTKYPAEVALHGNVVRAVCAMNSNNYGLVNAGCAWLQGAEVDADAQSLLGLNRAKERSSSIVRGISWLMSLGGPAVVALDQLDPIVTQLKLEHVGLQSTGALAIINKLAAGLSELRDLTRRTLIIVSCIDNTWKTLKEHTLKQFIDRYRPPRILQSNNSESSAAALISGRMTKALGGAAFAPPYPTWPFKESWVKQVATDNLREILKKCHDHIEECIRREQMVEVPPGWAEPQKESEKDFAPLDARFNELREAADVKPILDEEHEDDRFGELIRSALRCAVKEVKLPSGVDAGLDETFTGGANLKPLHARLRLVFPQENSREEHFCIRALQKVNARAFTARLTSAITLAGIDKSLSFRKLAIIRKTAYPGGAMTGKLVKQFEEFGGARLDPAHDDLMTLEALRLMEKESTSNFVEWLQARRHASNTQLIRSAIPGLFKVEEKTSQIPTEANVKAGAQSIPGSHAAPTPSLFDSSPANSAAASATPTDPRPKPAVQPPAKPVVPPGAPPAQTPNQILLGRRMIGENPSSQSTTIPIEALRKHGVIFAGAGSGKTVLLKRLIEETALLGIPAIVVDCANDLASIGDAWPTPPAEWAAGDAELARRFFDTTERIIWTPGRESGNPLGLEPLPDLAALVSSPVEMHEAIQMAVDALVPVIAAAPKGPVAKKQAILMKAFRFLGENGNCNLPGLGAVLRDLPDQVTAHIADERKFAKAMADDLFAQLAINPLLTSQGPVLDPTVLFGGHNGRTRVSIISFVGLTSQGAQQQFINQLAMTLFTWIKKNPAPANMPLRGILVIDEAKDFVPSQKSTPCLGSMQRLAAQARKYGLGVILATQNPKDLDNKIVGQCSTQWYGKMSAPAAIDAAIELLRARGSTSGDDVGALKTARFYVSNADYLHPPMKLATPMCLSAHGGPLDPEEVLKKAEECRQALG